MSNKNLINLIYNPSSLCMTETKGYSYEQKPNEDSPNPPAESLQMISEIMDVQKNPKAVVRALKKLKNFIHDDVPLSFRPELFKEMNHVIKTLQRHYMDSQTVFSASFHAITALKEQIDKNPQPESSLAELEWVELEKAVYLLCNWEDELDSIKFNHS